LCATTRGDAWLDGCWRNCRRSRTRASATLNERVHLVEQLLGVERLVDVIVSADPGATRTIVGLVLAREEQHRQLWRFPLELLAQIVAAGVTQHSVDQRDARALSSQLGQRVGRAFGQNGAEVFSGKGHFQDLAHGLAVVDGQQRGGHSSSKVWNDRWGIIDS
jgi:hypothetical protein